jgi:hypothetical protein
VRLASFPHGIICSAEGQVDWIVENIQSKEFRPKGPGFGLPPGRGLSMALLYSTYLWSIGVMEYWKNENPTPIFCNLEQKPSRFSDA